MSDNIILQTINAIIKDLGVATAYGYAKSKGYTGTEDEFAQLMASYATVAQQAGAFAEDSEAWAVGQRDGVDVDSEDVTYHNNSKYYSEQASDFADAAEEYWNNFSTDKTLTVKDKAADGKAVGDALAVIRAAVGTPLTANSADGMTDHERAYVYTGTTTSSLTNGHWYYYDNGWTDGGVYNSVALETDKTLTIPNMAPDSEVVGDEITDLKSAIEMEFDEKYLERINYFYVFTPDELANQTINPINGARNMSTQYYRTTRISISAFQCIDIGDIPTRIFSYDNYMNESGSTTDEKFISTYTGEITDNWISNKRIYLWGHQRFIITSRTANETDFRNNFKVYSYRFRYYDYYKNYVDYKFTREMWRYGYRIVYTTFNTYTDNVKTAMSNPFRIYEDCIIKVEGDYLMTVLTHVSFAAGDGIKSVLGYSVKDDSVIVRGNNIVTINLIYVGEESSIPIGFEDAITIRCSQFQKEKFDNKYVKFDSWKKSFDLSEWAQLRTPFRMSDVTGYYIGHSTANYNSGASIEKVFSHGDDVILYNEGSDLNWNVLFLNEEPSVVPIPNNSHVFIPANTKWTIFSTNRVSNLWDSLRCLKVVKNSDITENYLKKSVSFNMRRNWVTFHSFTSVPNGYTSGNTQDSDKYGNYYIITKSENYGIYLLDWETNSVLNSQTFDYNSFGHANSVCFSRQFLNDGDEIPLLLLSHWYKVDNIGHQIHVFHIDNEHNIELINTFTVQSETRGSTEFFYDYVNHMLYGVGWQEGSNETRTGLIVTSYWLNKNIDFSTVEEITSDNVVDSFFIPYIRILQGGCVIDGMLYLGTNNSNYKDTQILVVDISKKCIVETFDSSVLSSKWVNMECEGCFVVNDQFGEYSIGVSMQNGSTFEIRMLDRYYN